MMSILLKNSSSPDKKSDGGKSDEVEVRVLLPSSMTLNPAGKLILVQPMGPGGIVLLEEGAERTMVIRNQALKGVDKSPASVLSWVNFAERVSSLEDSLLVPTMMFGKAALLSRRAADIGDPVVIFAAADQSNSPSFGSSSQVPLDLTQSLTPPSSSSQSPLSPSTNFPQSLLALNNMAAAFHIYQQQQQQQQFAGGRSPTATSSASTPLLGIESRLLKPSTTVGRRAREKTMLPCHVCGKAFDRPSLLKRHMRTHTGEKPHICEVCNKGFSTSSSLNTHRRIHSGEKPHQCGLCGKRFTASSNLYYHRMTHNKDKPHKCNLCDKSFPTPGDLKSHQFVHSGVWPFRCHICNRGFSKQNNARNHILAHLTGMPVTDESTSPPPSIGGNSVTPTTSTSSGGITQSPEEAPKSLFSPASTSFSSPQFASEQRHLFSCPVCPDTLPSLAVLQLHLRSHLLMNSLSATSPQHALATLPPLGEQEQQRIGLNDSLSSKQDEDEEIEEKKDAKEQKRDEERQESS